jgi:glycosyltransferase involved in cell wall biosynthesis
LLQRADLVVAVSQPLVEDAIRRGADPDRVLLSPNATDPERFHPDIDGSAARRALGVEGRRTALLMSSFGPWHGVEPTITAYAKVLNRRPDLVDRTALILAGSGERERAARELAARLGLGAPNLVFTSMVPYEQSPQMLAAGDILLSPQISNPDGTRFFGSPTKVFEYLAMGRPIIASDLDQIGEVIRHESNGILVAPSDTEALATDLERVFDDYPRYAALGRQARLDAVTRHSWNHRVAKMRDALGHLGIALK